MTDNVYKGVTSAVGTVDLDAPIAIVEIQSCAYFSTAYMRSTEAARSAGDQPLADIYGFLQALTSMHPHFETPADPYIPQFQMEGRRSLLPQDLGPDDLKLVEELSDKTANPALRARLLDLVWLRKKDINACREAAQEYLAAAQRLDSATNFVYAAECFHRGVYLAGALGRGKDLHVAAVEALKRAVTSAASDDAGFRCAKYLRLLADFRACDPPADYAVLARGVAENAHAAGDAYRERSYRELEARLWQVAKDAEPAKAALLAAAETYVVEAAERAVGENASAMAAASLLTSGIEGLRRAGAPHERVRELRALLATYQRESLRELKPISTELNISELVAAAQSHVHHADLKQAVVRLALGDGLTNVAKLREAVVDPKQQSVFAQFMPVAYIDSSGRTVGWKQGLVGLEGEEREEQLLVTMFDRVAKIDWPFRVSTFIEPARQQVRNDHHPTYCDMEWLVTSNPFVPPGHEEMFLRGLHAGLHGDFLLATHLLVPQIENSIRYVLESNGADVTNLQSDRTQPVKVLGPLFDMPEMAETFGEDLCFELRGLLIEKAGYDFRNQVAHGFVTRDACFSSAALNVWWIVLRLCCIGLSVRERATQGSESS